MDDTTTIESETVLYQWGSNTAIRRFCKTCGILPFYTPRISPDSVAVTLPCVDFAESGTPPIEVQTFDGLHWDDSVVSTCVLALSSNTKSNSSSTLSTYDKSGSSDSTASSSYQSIPIDGDADEDVLLEKNIQNSISSSEQRTSLRSKTIAQKIHARVRGRSMNRVSKAVVGSSTRGDGDVWVEKTFKNSITGEERTYYCSKNTSKKVRDEPPTGASKIVTIYDIQKEGDGDVWVEKTFQNSKTGKRRTFFCSKNTGRKVRDEPPTGASKVVYL